MQIRLLRAGEDVTDDEEFRAAGQRLWWSGSLSDGWDGESPPVEARNNSDILVGYMGSDRDMLEANMLTCRAKYAEVLRYLRHIGPRRRSAAKESFRLSKRGIRHSFNRDDKDALRERSRAKQRYDDSVAQIELVKALEIVEAMGKE